MYWKINVLTKIGKELTLNLDGKKESILANLELDHLTVINMAPDFINTFQKILNKKTLSNATLRTFFIDFSRLLQSGLSVSEAISAISDISSDHLIKAGLERIQISINDGHALRRSFENAGIFPEIVNISLDAAEKSGQISGISEKLGEYFGYLNENKNKIINSLIYPVFVFIALTIASVVISIQLVPQLGFLMSENEMNSISMKLLVAYAWFMKDYWWLSIFILVIVFTGIWYVWNLNRDKLIRHVFNIPILGNVLKEVEFTNIFLNLFIYLKSGINITDALANIYSTQKTFITNKLIEIRNRINSGATLAQSFQKDRFFPSFIHQTMHKGDETGRRIDYIYELYKYYDSKSKESINTVIKLINPVLMSLAFAFAGFIASFYVLIYKKMGMMGMDIYH